MPDAARGPASAAAAAAALGGSAASPHNKQLLRELWATQSQP